MRFMKNEMKTIRTILSIVFAALVITTALILTFTSWSAQAEELSETWFSVRALGMGNAYTAVVDDADSLFYNPAGLAKISGFNWTVFDIHAGFNGPETIANLGGLTGGDGDLADKLAPLYGKPVWVGGGAKSALSIPGFAMAAFTSTNAGVLLRNPAYPTMNLNYFFDYGFAAGVGFEVVPSILKIGIVGRRVNRTGTTLPVGPAVLATNETSSLEAELRRRGTGYGADLGMTLTLPGPVKPSLSFVWKNAGSMQFKHEEGIGAPPSIEPEMIIGGALEISAPLITITPSFDYKYMDRPTIQSGRKIHLGVEISLPLIDIRAGFHQGYYTAGVGLDFGILRLDAATYGVELGEYPGQEEDRRYVAQLTFELGFDPKKFGIGGGGGKAGSGERRRLKQRR